MTKTILITGAGSGLGEGVALGLARQGYEVIAGAQIWPQVTRLKEAADAEGLTNLRVKKLDLLDSYDVKVAHGWDIDILFNNAGIGEGGPVSEIPLDLVRNNFESNVFAPLALTQGFVRRWIAEKRRAKIVFTSSVVGLITPPVAGAYSATKHALEAIAEALASELQSFGIQVQVINPGAYLTGFNERLAETAFRWLDDDLNFTKREQLHSSFTQLFGSDQMRLDPVEAIARMVEIVPSSTGRFRNVVPIEAETMLKKQQQDLWETTI
jgi:NAD(P)-dependent dehydrogenase (short-subunit alcohol dehydrogenase family)